MKKRVLSIIMSLILVSSAVLSTSLTASAATSYKYGISVDYANVKLGAGETYNINVKQSNNAKFVAYDYIPEGNCVDIVSQTSSTKSGTVTVRAFSDRYWSNGDLINIISSNYRDGLSISKLKLGQNSRYATSVGFNVYPAPVYVLINGGSGYVTLGEGEKITISESTNSGSYANPQNIKWSSSYPQATSVTKNSGNKATVTGNYVGNSVITVKTYNNKKDTIKVFVKPAPKSIKLSASSITIKRGQRYTISESTNSGSYANASNLVWNSNNSTIASITKGSANKATILGNKQGTTYVKVKTYNGKTATCKVTVK